MEPPRNRVRDQLRVELRPALQEFTCRLHAAAAHREPKRRLRHVELLEQEHRRNNPPVRNGRDRVGIMPRGESRPHPVRIAPMRRLVQIRGIAPARVVRPAQPTRCTRQTTRIAMIRITNSSSAWGEVILSTTCH